MTGTINMVGTEKSNIDRGHLANQMINLTGKLHISQVCLLVEGVQ